VQGLVSPCRWRTRATSLHQNPRLMDNQSNSSLGCNRHLLRNGLLAVHIVTLSNLHSVSSARALARKARVLSVREFAAWTFTRSPVSRSAFRDLLLGNDASSSLRADIKFRLRGKTWGKTVVYRHGA